MGARDLLKSTVAACFVAAMAGCAIQLPPSAVEVQEKDIRFLKQGTSTRDEVLHRLGQPNILGGKLVSVYEWRTARGLAIPVFPLDRGFVTGSNQSRLLVEFDEAGKVRHFAFAEYRYPGLYSTEPSRTYFIDDSAREPPRPAASLLKPSRSLGQSAGFWWWSPIDVQSSALTVSRDGRYVAMAPFTSDLQVWDLSTGVKRTFASGFKSSMIVNTIDVSRDGKMLAAAGSDDATVLWHMASGERLHVLRGHGKSTMWAVAGPATVEFAPDNRTVATGGRDGTVKLWDVASGKETSSFPIGGGTVQSLAFAPQGDLLAAGTSRGDVIIMDVVAGKHAKILHGSDELEHSYERTVGEEQLLAGRRVAFSRSGETLAANDCVAVELWRVSDVRGQIGLLAGRSPAAGKQQEPAIAFLLPYGKRPGCPGRERTFLAFSPDDEVLIASSNVYSVWDLRSRRLLAAWDVSSENHEPADLTLGPGTALLAWSDSHGKGIQIIDLAPIIREAKEGEQRAGSQGAAR